MILEDILATLRDHGEITSDEILEHLPGYTSKQIKDNIGMAVHKKMVFSFKDVIGPRTYKITHLGKERIGFKVVTVLGRRPRPGSEPVRKVEPIARPESGDTVCLLEKFWPLPVWRSA